MSAGTPDGRSRSAAPVDTRPDGGTGPLRRDAAGAPVRIRYAVIGVVLGGAWAANWGLPPWEHALRLVVLLLVVVPVVNLARSRHLRRRGRPAEPSSHLRGLVISKVILVALALVVEIALERWLPLGTATTVVALLLFVVVVVAGPPSHGWIVAGGRRRARIDDRTPADEG